MKTEEWESGTGIFLPSHAMLFLQTGEKVGSGPNKPGLRLTLFCSHSLTNFRPLSINGNGTEPPAYFVYFASLLKSIVSSLMFNLIVFKIRMCSFCCCKRTASQEELFLWFWPFLIFSLTGEIVILTKLAENMPCTAHTRGDTFHEAIYSVDKGFLGHFWHVLYTYLKMSFSVVNSTLPPSLAVTDKTVGQREVFLPLSWEKPFRKRWWASNKWESWLSLGRFNLWLEREYLCQMTSYDIHLLAVSQQSRFIVTFWRRSK